MKQGKNTLSVRAMKVRFLLREMVDASRARKMTGNQEYVPGFISTALAIGGDDVMVRASEFSDMFPTRGEDESLAKASARIRQLLNKMHDLQIVNKYIIGEPQQFAGDPSGWHYCYSLNSVMLNDIKREELTLDAAAVFVDEQIINSFQAGP